jgi:hypothetical protein
MARIVGIGLGLALVAGLVVWLVGAVFDVLGWALLVGLLVFAGVLLWARMTDPRHGERAGQARR